MFVRYEIAHASIKYNRVQPVHLANVMPLGDVMNGNEDAFLNHNSVNVDVSEDDLPLAVRSVLIYNSAPFSYKYITKN